MTVKQEAEVLKQLLDETREQVKMMAHQIDDYETALKAMETDQGRSMTEYQRAIYRMFEAFVGEKQ